MIYFNNFILKAIIIIKYNKINLLNILFEVNYRIEILKMDTLKKNIFLLLLKLFLAENLILLLISIWFQ